ncbi:hypothetical protein [Maritalea porphyrae]|uniref:ABC transporter permease n=1 Tax=Maritalea porphyrae TaxID=880732 RepID=A0ABQ5UU48_9HYPH|nr:hypothetical protein [Maritalea porphyrae]GLQ18798.1 hypothetical protein GCM10007879_30470 [Maritalea porphyrae]
MRSWVALVKREFLEHRGAFLYAPAIITLVVTTVLAIAILMNQPEFAAEAGEMPGSVLFYEVTFMATFLLWAMYMLIALFFYFSDAFHSDRRNNSMLFWKSMPKSDLEILGSKVLSGYTIFPLAIGFWVMVTGVIAYVFAQVIDMVVVFYTAPSIMQFINSYIQVLLVGSFYALIALLWYAPIFGWAAFLGTLFKRWSIPLFFVIPALAVLLERVINIRDLAYESQILRFIQFRLEMVGEDDVSFDPEVWIMSNTKIDAWGMISYGFTQIDWLHMVIGWAILGGFIYLASEYRRRLIEA